MTSRTALGAALVFCFALPSAAQVRVATPGALSVVPAFLLALSPAPGPFFSSPALPQPLAPGLRAPALSPKLAPIPALAGPAIAAASVPLPPVFSLRADSAPAKDAGGPSGARAPGAIDFDGASAKPALEPVVPAAPRLPAGAKSVSVVRADGAKEAMAFIPNTGNAKAVLAANWPRIGRLDFRVYVDAKGGRMRAVDLSGRPELAVLLPDVHPHEAELIRKIQLHSGDVQLVIRVDGLKTPDLIVDGVMTEMKSRFRNGKSVPLLLADANEQVSAHARRHRLGPGAAAIDLRHRRVVPVGKVRAALNAYVRTGVAIGFASVSVYAGNDRKVFVRGADGRFDVRP